MLDFIRYKVVLDYKEPVPVRGLGVESGMFTYNPELLTRNF
jgi:hypothetical protein